jgi:3',5'-nucleoside bisphosphate phosphatase
MIDLHLHSTASDGTKTPREIVELANSMSLSAIALTDHDTVSGIDEFLSTLEKYSLSGIPGVEIAMLWQNREYHVLGYWIDHKNDQLLDLLGDIRKNRTNRNTQIIKKLNDNNMKITIDEILEKAKGESIGRPHIAAVLVEKGYFDSVKDVFSTCLAAGGTGYVPRVLPDPKTAIQGIKNAGGISVWAHPFHRGKTNHAFTDNLKCFLEFGLDGVEAYYTEYSMNQQDKILKITDDLDLPVSGGTDYHGDNQPGIYMGTGRGNLKIPDSVYRNLLNYHQN